MRIDPRISVLAARPCACGWRVEDCEREGNIDGDSSGHDARLEHRAEEEASYAQEAA